MFGHSSTFRMNGLNRIWWKKSQDFTAICYMLAVIWIGDRIIKIYQGLYKICGKVFRRIA